MLWHHGEEQQWLGCAGVDKAVRMTLRTVVALADRQALFAVVVETACLTAEDEYDFDNAYAEYLNDDDDGFGDDDSDDEDEYYGMSM